MTPFRTALLVLMIAQSNGTWVRADEPITMFETMASGQGFFHGSPFSFGDVSPGDTKRVVLLVRNITGKPLSLGKSNSIFVRGVALKVRDHEAQIPVGGTGAIEVDVAIEKEPRVTEVNFALQFAENNFAKFPQLRVYGNCFDVASFPEELYRFQYSEDDSNIQMSFPIVLSSNLSWQSFRIRAEAPLEQVQWKTEEREGKLIATGTIERGRLTETNLTTNVWIENSKTSKRVGRTSVSLVENPFVQVLPSTLVMSPTGVNGSPEGSAIIRINPKLKTEAVIESIDARFSSDEKVKVGFTRIGSNLFKVFVTAEAVPRDPSGGLPKLTWDIFTTDGPVEVETEVLLSKIKRSKVD